MSSVADRCVWVVCLQSIPDRQVLDDTASMFVDNALAPLVSIVRKGAPAFDRDWMPFDGLTNTRLLWGRLLCPTRVRCCRSASHTAARARCAAPIDREVCEHALSDGENSPEVTTGILPLPLFVLDCQYSTSSDARRAIARSRTKGGYAAGDSGYRRSIDGFQEGRIEGGMVYCNFKVYIQRERDGMGCRREYINTIETRGP